MSLINNIINNTISIKDSIIVVAIEPFLFLLALFFARVMFYGKKYFKSNIFEKLLLIDLKYKRPIKYRVPECVFVVNLITFIIVCLIYVAVILHISLFCQVTSIICKIMLMIYLISCLVYFLILYHYKLEDDRRQKRVHRH